MSLLLKIISGLIGGILAPLYAHKILLLYQLSGYRIKELATAIKRKSIAYFCLSPIAAIVAFVACGNLSVLPRRRVRFCCRASVCRRNSGGGKRASVGESETRVYCTR